MRKAVFFDIDGTLVDENETISESTREAIKLLRENNILTFICTGRSYGAVSKEILDLGFDGVISGVGTFIMYHDKCIFNHELEEQDVQELKDKMDELGIDYVFEGKEYIYTKEELLHNVKPGFQIFMERFKKILRSIEKEKKFHVNKFTCSFNIDSIEKMNNFIKEYKTKYSAIVHESVDTEDITNPYRNKLVEFTPYGFNKATGIKEAMRLLDIPWEGTFAFGDSNNDIEMLDYVKYSVCMGGGTMKAKKVSKYITDDINKNGIYNALKHYQLI